MSPPAYALDMSSLLIRPLRSQRYSLRLRLLCPFPQCAALRLSTPPPMASALRPRCYRVVPARASLLSS